MGRRGVSRAPAWTVAATILACLLVVAASTIPAYGQQATETSTPPGTPETSTPPEAPETSTPPADVEPSEDESAPAPEGEPQPTQTFEPTDEPSPGQPVGAAGSTPQQAFVPEGGPQPDDAPEGAGSGSSSSARAAGPGLSSSLRSSSGEEPFDEGVEAPLVAPPDVAGADGRGPRGAGTLSDALGLADRELLALADPFASGPSTLTVGSDTPAWPVPLAFVLLLLMTTWVGRTYAGQRSRAKATSA